MYIMKIGIMTFWWSNDNYGQLLQCYALQKYLRDLGHDPFLIRYRETNASGYSLSRILKAFNPSKLLKYLTIKKRLKQSQTEELVHPRNFDAFRSKYLVQSELIYDTYEDLKKNPPKADMYIVGSDQVWNFGSPNKTSMNAFFLNFGNKNTKRVSYAASFGTDSLSLGTERHIKTLLKNFEFVTVRENSGKDICNKMDIASKVVCDPTLLLSTEQWSQLKESGIKIGKKYIFLYLLTNSCKISVNKLKKWADSKQLDLIYVSGNTAYYQSNYDDEGIEKSYLTINQWVNYLSNAEYVITNSFHCCVFSFIFSRKIGIVPLLTRTNDRINSLFENLGTKKTVIKNDEFSVLEMTSELHISSGTEFIEQSKSLLELIVK